MRMMEADSRTCAKRNQFGSLASMVSEPENSRISGMDSSSRPAAPTVLIKNFGVEG